MHSLRCGVAIFVFPLLGAVVSAQQKQTAPTSHATTKDVDPLALKVLRAVDQPIQQAQAFSFKALISEEQLATDGQLITFFHTVNVLSLIHI